MANKPVETPTRSRFRWRPRLLLAVLLIGVIAVSWWVLRRYTDSERVRAMAEAYLQRYAVGRVVVAGADFSWRDGVHLYDVEVFEAPRDGAAPGGDDSDVPAEPVFSCRFIELGCDPWEALLGRLTFESITAGAPTCVIVRDEADGATNLAGLLRRVGQFDEDADITSLPSIELRDARVRVINRDGRRERLVEDLKLTVRGATARENTRFYDIVWHGGGKQIASGHSRIDLKAGSIRNVSGGLPWMSLEAVMIAVNARYTEAGAWCDLLGLEGRVRARDYDLGGATEPGARRYATIELNNTSLSIPLSHQEQPLPPDQRYLRFDRVYGTIEVSAEGLHAEFEGLFHGAACDVSADFHGGVDEFTSLEDIAFEMRGVVKGFDLPQSDPDAPAAARRFINHWPKLAKFFEEFDPHGHLDLEIIADKRAGADEPIIVQRLVAMPRGGDASCLYFPYRVTDLSGDIIYTPDGIVIHDLRGRHGDGEVVVEGWAGGPTRCDAVRLWIRGLHVPIDDELRASVPAKYSQITEEYQPEGSVDLDISLARPACANGELGMWHTDCSLAFDDLSACYVRFPYPVEHLRGSLFIDRHQVQIENIVGEANGATIGVNGVVVLGKNRATDLDIVIIARDLPLDDELMTALPDGTRRQLWAFNPTGRCDVLTDLSLDPETGETLHVSKVAPLDMTIQHESLPVTVTNVTGDITFSSEEVAIEQVVGRYHDAVVSATGSIDLTREPSLVDVIIDCTDLAIDEELRDALPEGLAEVLGDWRIDGPVHTETRMQTDPTSADGRLTTRTLAGLSGASVRHALFPIPFTDVHAEIDLDETQASADGITARYGQAIVSANLDVRTLGDKREGAIEVTALGAVLDDTLRGILPEGFREVWDRDKPHGIINLYFDSLRYEKPGPGAPGTWRVNGRLDLFDVGFGGTTPIDGMSGPMTVSGALVDRLGGMSLGGVLQVSTAKLFGQTVGDIEAPWSFTQVADGEGRFALDSVHGTINDGTMTAQLAITFDAAPTRYELSITVEDMEIATFLSDGVSESAATDEEDKVSGLANAYLYVSGVLSDPLSKRGGGLVEIRDGHFYRLPIILAILHVINLSVPDGDAFDDIEADFYIVGNRVKLKDILLRGSALALFGGGSMSLPDRGLDLKLFYVNPNRWTRVPGVTDFVERAMRPLTELHITGPLHRPTVRPRPFKSVSDELRDLFKRKKPEKIEPAGS